MNNWSASVYFLIMCFMLTVNAHAESKLGKATDTIPFMPYIAPTIIVAAPFQVKTSGVMLMQVQQTHGHIALSKWPQEQH